MFRLRIKDLFLGKVLVREDRGEKRNSSVSSPSHLLHCKERVTLQANERELCNRVDINQR